MWIAFVTRAHVQQGGWVRAYRAAGGGETAGNFRTYGYLEGEMLAVTKL